MKIRGYILLSTKTGYILDTSTREILEQQFRTQIPSVQIIEKTFPRNEVIVKILLNFILDLIKIINYFESESLIL